MSGELLQIVVLQEREFKVAYKKLYPNQRAVVNAAVREIVDNPMIGVEKKGDLKGVFVHKFKCLDRQFLLAYQWNPYTRTLLALGVHENFYKNIKRGL